MQVEISPQNNEFIDRQVARGEFRDRRAALDAAVDLLRRRTDTLEKIDNGRQQLDAGEVNEYDDETLKTRFDQIKQRAQAATLEAE